MTKRSLLLLPLVMLAACGSTVIPSGSDKTSLPIKANGTEYIPRNRIINAPGGAVPSEVVYPNGEVKQGAFTPPEGTEAPIGVTGAVLATATAASAYERHVTQPGLSLIRREEGFESCPYFDSAGTTWTIGIGEAYVSAYTPCESEYTAYRKLESQLARNYEWSIRAIGGNGFPQRVFNSLLDFDYNEGPYIFQINPGLTSLLEQHRWYAASEVMLSFDIAGGHVLGDLYRRRVHEQEMMLGPEPPVAETAAQKAARVHRERESALATDERKLEEAKGRKAVLHVVLGRDGCIKREHEHKAVGPKCKRWKREGNERHGEIIRLNKKIATLRRELA